MRRLVSIAVVAALLSLLVASVRADEDESSQRMGKRVQMLLDIVTDLRKEMVDLRTRVTELETNRERARKQEEPKEPKTPDYSGLVRVPRSTCTIPAYAMVTRDHILDSQGNVAWLYLRPGDVSEEMLTSEHLGQIIGRVLRRTKPPGYVFTKHELYPPGTRPGPIAGVPTGKRAARLAASDIPGLHGLMLFDRFDLVMTVTVDVEEGPAEDEPASASPPSRVRRRRVEVRTIVDNGLVVQPATPRDHIRTTSILLGGARRTMTPIEEVIIAVDPDEFAALSFALAVEARIQVALRSGQVSEGVAEEGVIPDLERVIVDEPDITEGSPHDEASGPRTSPSRGGPERVPPEAVGVYAVDRRASVETMVAKTAAGATSPEQEAAIREWAEETIAGLEMTLELRADGTFEARIDRGDGEEQTAGGTWALVGEMLTLVTTHEGGREKPKPDDEVSGTWKDGRITLYQDGFHLVVVLVREPR